MKQWKVCLLIIVLLLLAAAAAFLLLNRWQLRLELRGEEDCTLEYGEPYREPGAEAVFGGTLFPALFSPEVISSRMLLSSAWSISDSLIRSAGRDSMYPPRRPFLARIRPACFI